MTTDVTKPPPVGAARTLAGFLAGLLATPVVLTALAHAPWPLWVNLVGAGSAAAGMSVERRLRGPAAGVLTASVAYGVFFGWLFSRLGAGAGTLG